MMFRHILVPTDGSSLSDKAVRHAVACAKEVGAKVCFLFARADGENSIYGESSLLRSIDPNLLSSLAKQQAERILLNAEQSARLAGVVSEGVCAITDEPYEAIIATAQAKGCDLIIMASHGHRGVKGLLIGSQTQKVLTHSTVPVLVYR